MPAFFVAPARALRRHFEVAAATPDRTVVTSLVAFCGRSTMDSVAVSEAVDVGSIPAARTTTPANIARRSRSRSS